MNSTLKKSGYLQIISDGEMNIVWHSLFGYPMIVNQETIDFLNAFSSPVTINDVKNLSLFSEVEENAQMLQECFFIIPNDLDERRLLKERAEEYDKSVIGGRNIEYLSLILSENCNFACSYCISSSMISASHRKANKKKIMSIETALKAVKIFLSILKENKKENAYINFGGGEPLINAEIMRHVLEYCYTNYRNAFEFKFRINTNASLISQGVAKILKNYDVRPAISLDGLKDANDKVRLTKNGKGTFGQIMKGIESLRQANFPPKGFSTTVTENNFDLISEDLIQFAEKERFIDLRIDLDVIHLLSIPVDNAVKKLLSLKQTAHKKGINVSGFWERPAENLNSSIIEKHIAFCGGVAGKSMCVSPSEEVYICGYSSKAFANLSKEEIKSSTAYHNIVMGRMAGEIERCKGCSIEGQCAGGCFITEEFHDLKKEAALSYNCDLYRKMAIELLKISLKEALPNITSLRAERRSHEKIGYHPFAEASNFQHLPATK